ncbi:MAG: lysozyme inhibitor LprI family protein [Hoeflea sp.]|uniref:lysozyme inhibitor LprI family protein n=1 Tax=Hoeflea sp. TaxID=1940281 RepID=UPI003EF61C68
MKNLIFFLIFCIGGFSATPAAFSQSTLCQDSVTTPDIVECLTSHLNLMDGDLNRTYQELRADLNKADYAKLLKAQRGWIDFRDAECARIADYASGGTMAPILKLGCLMKLTERRIEDLSTNPLTGEIN